MPHVLKLKDGKFLTAFAIEDVLDAVEEYAGDEVRRYLAENLTDTAALEQELDETYKEHEKELEQLTDYQRSVLCDIQEEADALDELLDAPRLDRKKLKKNSKQHLADVQPGIVIFLRCISLFYDRKR